MVMTPSLVRETATKSLQFALQGVRWETFQKLMGDLSPDCGCQITYDQDNQLLLVSQHSQNNSNRIIILNNLTWETFENLMSDVEGSRGWRFVYDQGVLEIRMPLQEHEEPKEFLMDFITVLVDELGLEMIKLGALTLKREDLNRGLEPDSCCYIQNEFLVRGKDIDLTVVPPPDLAVESDYTNSSLNKFEIYAALGVPEFWIYRKQKIEVYLLTEGRYELSDTSLALPLFPINEAAALIKQHNGKKGQRAIVRLFRVRIQEVLKTL